MLQGARVREHCHNAVAVPESPDKLATSGLAVRDTCGSQKNRVSHVLSVRGRVWCKRSSCKRELLGGAGIVHLDEGKERLDGCEGSEDVDVEDALELVQFPVSGEGDHG